MNIVASFWMGGGVARYIEEDSDFERESKFCSKEARYGLEEVVEPGGRTEH